MKRSLKYLSILFALILVLTGCGKKSEKDQFIDALKKTNEAKSLKENVQVDLGFTVEGQKVNYTLSANGEAYKEDENTATAHEKIKIGMLGLSYEFDTYMDVNKEGFGMYLNMANQWLKAEDKFTEDELKQMEQYKETFKDLKDVDYSKTIKEVKSEKSDKKGYTKLNVTFDKDKINEELKNTYNKVKEEAEKVIKEQASTNDATEINESIDEFTKILDKGFISEDIKITVYLKDGYLAIVQIDGTSLVKNMLNSLKTILGDDESFKEMMDEFEKADLKANITIEMSDFNKVDKIEIPAEAKNGKDFDDESIDDSSLFGSFLGA